MVMMYRVEKEVKKEVMKEEANEVKKERREEMERQIAGVWSDERNWKIYRINILKL